MKLVLIQTPAEFLVFANPGPGALTLDLLKLLEMLHWPLYAIDPEGVEEAPQAAPLARFAPLEPTVRATTQKGRGRAA